MKLGLAEIDENEGGGDACKPNSPVGSGEDCSANGGIVAPSVACDLQEMCSWSLAWTENILRQEQAGALKTGDEE